MIQTLGQSIYSFNKGPHLELFLQSLLEMHRQQNPEEMKRILLQLADRRWFKEDLQTIYRSVIQKPSRFYDAMKWGLYNKLEECESILLDVVFILSCIFIDSEDSSQLDEQLSGVENLNDKSFSFGSITDSKQKSYAEVDYKAKISKIILRLQQQRLVELIQFLVNKDKLSELQALETLYQRNISEKHGLKLGSVFVQTKQFREAMHMFINQKEQSISVPCFIDVMIANCYMKQQPHIQQDYGQLEIVVDNRLVCNFFHALESCLSFGNKHFSQRNYVKAYHYYTIVWRMLKHPQAAHHLAKTLEHLGQYDDAYEVLIECKNKCIYVLSIDKAIDLNLLGDIETQRGNFEAGYKYIQQSFQQFHNGYEENRQVLDLLHRQQSCLFIQGRPSQDIYKNYYSLAVNFYKTVEAFYCLKKRQQFDNKSRQAIKIFQEFIRKVSIEYPEPYMYLTQLYIWQETYAKAEQSFKKGIKIFKRQQMKIKTYQKLLFLQMTIFNLGHLLDSQTLKEAQGLVEQAEKEIQRSITGYMSEGKQYFQRGEYSTAVLAFKQVIQIRRNAKIPNLHYFVLACYQRLGQFSKGYQYFEKQVDQVYLNENICLMLQKYCSEKASRDKLQSFFEKVRLDTKNKGIYLRFIELIVNKKQIELAKNKLQLVQALYSQQQSSQDYNQLGMVYSLMQNHVKAIQYFRKGLERDLNKQKNQFYLTRLLKSLHKLAASVPPEQLQNIFNRLDLKSINDSGNLTQVGSILLQRGRASDALEYFDRAFEVDPNEVTYSSLYKVCDTLNLKGKSILCIRKYIQKLEIELRFEKSDGDRKIKLLKSLIGEAKKLEELDASQLQLLQEGCTLTIKQQYFSWLLQLVTLILTKARLSSDEFVAELITLYLIRQDFERALGLIKQLLQKYPRYSAFLKMKDYCSAVHHQRTICQKCLLNMSSINNLLIQLFLVTEIDDCSESIRCFSVFYDELKEKAKDKKNALLFIDLSSLLKAAEVKQKSKAPLLSIFRAMIPLVKEKIPTEKGLNSYSQAAGRKEPNNQQFKSGIQLFLQQCQTVSKQSQKQLFSLLYNSLGNLQKTYLLEMEKLKRQSQGIQGLQ